MKEDKVLPELFTNDSLEKKSYTTNAASAQDMLRPQNSSQLNRMAAVQLGRNNATDSTLDDELISLHRKLDDQGYNLDGINLSAAIRTSAPSLTMPSDELSIPISVPSNLASLGNSTTPLEGFQGGSLPRSKKGKRVSNQDRDISERLEFN